MPFVEAEDRVQKGESNLISDEELVALYALFDNTPGTSSDYLKILRHTGMRAKEGLGLTTDDIFLGANADEKMYVYDTLKANGIKFYGYILLKHQLLSDTNSKEILFGPLKHKKTM